MPETRTLPSANQEGPNPHFSAAVAQMMVAMLSREYFVEQLQQLSPELIEQRLNISNFESMIIMHL